jgi:hypothetical protein
MVARADADTLKADWIMGAPSPNQISKGIVFMEPTIYPMSASYLRVGNGATATIDSFCKSLNDSQCAVAPSLDYKAYVPRCDLPEDLNCIDEFWLEIDGTRYSPKFVQYAPENFVTSFTGNSRWNLPSGKAPSIWKIDNFKGGTNTKYFAVSAQFSGILVRQSDGGFSTFRNDIEVTVDEVSLEFGGQQPPNFDIAKNRWTLNGCLSNGCYGVQIGYCAAIGNGLCARRENNSEGISYGISLRLTNPPVNWIHGRIEDQIFSVEKIDGYYKWIIFGKPIALPVSSVWISESEWIKKFGQQNAGEASTTSWVGPINAGITAMESFAAWEPFLESKASAMQSRWSFRTIGNGNSYNGRTIQFCNPDNKVIGFVSTNAMVYQGEPPQWNSDTDSLDYKVAAPHFKPSGELLLGQYVLQIDEAIARCIYGFMNSQLVATISILSPDGTSRVATSTFSRRDNWLVFNVSGYTYSSPTIQVKLEAVPAPIVTPSDVSLSTPKPTPTITRTVLKTCKSISSKRIIKTKAAKCPTGYKLVK